MLGIRIIKTAVAVLAAMYIAAALGLHTPLSAGLLAILGVDVTKRKSIRTSFQRIAASVLGLALATALFWLFGFQLWVAGVYVLALYPLLTRLNLREGVVTSSVVMFHLFGSGQVTTELLLNEVALLLTGLGTATIVNVAYMPREEKRLAGLRTQLEQLFSQMFREIGSHLTIKGYIWSGSELLEAERVLELAQQTAQRARDNRLLGDEPYWPLYFYMRKQQLESIERMAQLVARVYEVLPHGEILAAVFAEISDDVRSPYYTGRAERKLDELEGQFKRMELPRTREEFEVRSALLQLMMELRAFLAIAKKEKRPAPERLS